MKPYKDPTADEAIGRVMAKRKKTTHPPRSPHTIHYRERKKVPGKYIKVNAHFP